MVCGWDVQVYSTYNDMITGVDNTYGLIPRLPYPVNFIYMAGNVILPLKYPDYTFEVGWFADVDIPLCADPDGPSRVQGSLWLGVNQPSL